MRHHLAEDPTTYPIIIAGNKHRHRLGRGPRRIGNGPGKRRWPRGVCRPERGTAWLRRLASGRSRLGLEGTRGARGLARSARGLGSARFQIEPMPEMGKNRGWPAAGTARLMPSPTSLAGEREGHGEAHGNMGDPFLLRNKGIDLGKNEIGGGWISGQRRAPAAR